MSKRISASRTLVVGLAALCFLLTLALQGCGGGSGGSSGGGTVSTSSNQSNQNPDPPAPPTVANKLAFGYTVGTTQAKGRQLRSSATYTWDRSTSGTKMVSAIQVNVVDANNSLVTYSGDLTIASSAIPFTATSTTTVTASNGQAAFANLALSTIGTTNLTVSGSGLTPITVSGIQVVDVTDVTMKVSNLQTNEEFIAVLIEQGGDLPIGLLGVPSGSVMNAYAFQSHGTAAGTTATVSLKNVPLGMKGTPYLFCLGNKTKISASALGSAVTVAGGLSIDIAAGTAGSQATRQGELIKPVVSVSPSPLKTGSPLFVSVTGGLTGTGPDDFVNYVLAESTQTILQCNGKWGLTGAQKTPEISDFANPASSQFSTIACTIDTPTQTLKTSIYSGSSNIPNNDPTTGTVNFSANVSSSVSQLKFSGFDTNGGLVFGPSTQAATITAKSPAKTASATVTGVPLTVTRMVVEFLDANGNTVGNSTGAVSFQSGTATVTASIVNPTVAFAVVNTGTGDGLNSVWNVYRSTDGGSTWSKASTSALKPATTGDFINGVTRMSFVSATEGWIIVDESNVQGTLTPTCLQHTSDGGATWEVLANTATGSLYTGLSFVDSNTGYVTVSKGDNVPYLYSTSTGGKTFTKETLPGTANLESVYASPTGLVVAGGSSQCLWTRVSSTWKQRASSNVNSYVSDVASADGVHVEAVSPVVKGCDLYDTVDGGATFQSSGTGLGAFDRVAAFGDKSFARAETGTFGLLYHNDTQVTNVKSVECLTASGQIGLVGGWNGTIFRSSDSGAIWTAVSTTFTKEISAIQLVTP